MYLAESLSVNNEDHHHKQALFFILQYILQLIVNYIQNVPISTQKLLVFSRVYNSPLTSFKEANVSKFLLETSSLYYI